MVYLTPHGSYSVDCRKKKLLPTSLPTLTRAPSDPSGDEAETSRRAGPAARSTALGRLRWCRQGCEKQPRWCFYFYRN